MKLHATTIAIAIAAFSASATAATGNQQPLRPVHVVASDISGCTPPADAPSCENFHRWIRANFSDREIGMLFGAHSSYPEYLSGGIDALQRRYEKLLQGRIAAPRVARAPVVSN